MRKVVRAAMGWRSARVLCRAMRVASECRGVAALEFALITPVMIAMMAGLFDLTNAFLAWQRVTATSQAVSEVATAMAATADSKNTLLQTSATAAAAAIYAYLPATVPPESATFGVTLSSIVMVPTVVGCNSNCSYTAHTAWSGVFQGAGAVRPCDKAAGQSALTAVSDDSLGGPATLPVDVYAATPLLAVDVTYQFKPLFLFFITGDIQMRRSAYFPTRTGRVSDWIHYEGANAASVRCPGWAT